MEINENIAGLGKNHDREAHDEDLTKKQSEAQPAAENLEMEPHSKNKDGEKGFGATSGEIHNQAAEYAKKEHEKAEGWENPNESGPDKPQF